MGLDKVKAFLRKGTDEFPCIWKPGLEADDVVGILATIKDDQEIVGDKITVVSSDKDLKQIPGSHYCPLKNRHWVLSEEASNRFFYQQVLTGDPVDGFIGCPGVGPVKSEKYLSKASGAWTLWDCVVSAYLRKGLTEADALVQARVAKILHAENYNWEKQEVIPWTPPPRF